MLTQTGIERVLNLVEEREYQPGERESVQEAYARAGIDERRLDFVDFGNLDSAALETAVAEARESLEAGLTTYIHCRAGWQRSAVIAAGVIAVMEDLDADAALAFVQARKPSADPLPHQREDLRRWLADRGGTVPG